VDLQLGALSSRLREAAPEEAAAVETAAETVHSAGVRLRNLLFELETPVLDASLAEGLRDAGAHVFEHTDVVWSVEERGDAPLPQQVRVSAYRIAREAMVNARKHAGAGRVTVTVDATDRGVEVHVVDDGAGVAVPAAPRSGRRHSGIVGMRDRAAASGGWWRWRAGPRGIGTDVSFFLPVAPHAAPDVPGPGTALAGEQPAYDVGGARHGHDEMTEHAPAQQPGEVSGDGSLEEVGRAARREDARPRGGVRLR